MLKLIRLSAALGVAAVIMSFPQIARSRPESGTSGYSAMRNSRSGSLFCYMQTPQGTTLNLENLCRADDGSSNTAANLTTNPATTPPNGTAPNGVPNGQQPVTTTTVNGSVVPNTANNTNPNTIGNPNGINPSSMGNPNGINPNSMGNPNGINPNVNNSNLNGTNPNAINSNVNNSNPNGMNSNVNNSNPSGINSSPNNLQ